MPLRLRDLVLWFPAVPLAASISGAQEPVPPPPPVPESRPAEGARPVFDAQGKPIEPGVLPASASEEARALFEKLCAASLGPGHERKPIEAFDLSLDVLQRSAGQSNDVKARYRYRAPGWVRTTIEESKREHIRGPEGDFLVDPKSKTVTKLDIGRENAEDRREIEDTLRIARNFLALTDPRSLRILSLEKVGPPRLVLPPSVRSEDLAWLEVRTPDFQAGTGASPEASATGATPPSPAIASVRLGVDPKTGLVATALVDANEKRAGRRESALLLALEKPEPIDGFQVPTRIRIFHVEEESQPPAFSAKPTSDIFVIANRSKLRANLGPDDFRP